MQATHFEGFEQKGTCMNFKGPANMEIIQMCTTLEANYNIQLLN